MTSSPLSLKNQCRSPWRTIKAVPEVCRIFCATANLLEVVVGETERGRGVLGVIDGSPPAGVETHDDEVERKQMLRRFGYKL